MRLGDFPFSPQLTASALGALVIGFFAFMAGVDVANIFLVMLGLLAMGSVSVSSRMERGGPLPGAVRPFSMGTRFAGTTRALWRNPFYWTDDPEMRRLAAVARFRLARSGIDPDDAEAARGALGPLAYSALIEKQPFRLRRSRAFACLDAVEAIAPRQGRGF